MKLKLLELFMVIVVLAFLAWPVVHIYATVSTCGWKGLFVECRIVDLHGD